MLGEMTHVDLADFDVVWLRQDPPFDMHYITTTHLLERLAPGTLVVNDPFWVRNSPEKLLVLDFPDLTPPTTIARDLRDDQGVPGAAWRRHPQAALRQWRRRCLPARRRRPQPDVAARDVHRLLARAADRAEIPARRDEGRQAHHPRRRRARGRDQPRSGGGRGAVEHACGRPPREGRADRARPRDLRRDRAAAAGKGPDLRRDRRDRRLADRDQRDLSHRHSGAGAVRRR